MMGISSKQSLTGNLEGSRQNLIGNIVIDTVIQSGGVSFTTDETLSLKNGVLSVNTAHEPEPDNTLPITAAAVHTTVGNIEKLLETI